MHGYYSFTVRPEATDERVLVVFCATAQPHVDEVVTVVQRHCRTEFSPDRIVLLGLVSEQEM